MIEKRMNYYNNYNILKLIIINNMILIKEYKIYKAKKIKSN